jgi:hypothetical protein
MTQQCTAAFDAVAHRSGDSSATARSERAKIKPLTVRTQAGKAIATHMLAAPARAFPAFPVRCMMRPLTWGRRAEVPVRHLVVVLC